MDGSLRTSVVEYSHFLVMLLHGGRFMDRQVLQPETVAAMLTPQKVAIPPMEHGVVPFVDQTLVWPVYRLGDNILWAFSQHVRRYAIISWAKSGSLAWNRRCRIRLASG